MRNYFRIRSYAVFWDFPYILRQSHDGIFDNTQMQYLYKFLNKYADESSIIYATLIITLYSEAVNLPVTEFSIAFRYSLSYGDILSQNSRQTENYLLL